MSQSWCRWPLIRPMENATWNKIYARYAGGNELLKSILAAYTAPGRYYHNARHLAEMTELICNYSEKTGMLENLIHACLYHDIVYDSRAKDNEEKSAVRARYDLSLLGLSANDIDFIAELILSTQKHQPVSKNFDGLLFLDADLAILGADTDRYGDYLNAVRREYSWVPEAEYRRERTRILKKFLERERIYFTEEIFTAREYAARKNLESEIEMLARPDQPESNERPR